MSTLLWEIPYTIEGTDLKEKIKDSSVVTKSKMT